MLEVPEESLVEGTTSRYFLFSLICKENNLPTIPPKTTILARDSINILLDKTTFLSALGVLKLRNLNPYKIVN